MPTVVIKDAIIERSPFSQMICHLELTPIYNWMRENMTGEYSIVTSNKQIAIECVNDHDALMLSLMHGIK